MKKFKVWHWQNKLIKQKNKKVMVIKMLNSNLWIKRVPSKLLIKTHSSQIKLALLTNIRTRKKDNKHKTAVWHP